MKTRDGLTKELRKHAQNLDQLATLVENGHINEIGVMGAVHLSTKALEDDVAKIVCTIFTQPPLFPV